MEKKSSSLQFIFWLKLSEELEPQYFAFDQELKKRGFRLIPVEVGQLTTMFSLSEASHFTLLCATRNLSQFKNFKNHAQRILRTIVPKMPLTFFHLSSFQRLETLTESLSQKKYFFIRYPVSIEAVTEMVVEAQLSNQQSSSQWPGGRRSKLPAQG